MTDTHPTLLLGDCAERMRELQDCSVDSIVCDPPYGIAFMGSKWDNYGQRCGDATVDERRRIAEDYAEAHAGAPRYGNSRCDTRNSRREILNFQAAMTPIFAEALRVAKPGAYMCCFGSPRTYHRLTCAIEDAGWNVVDCVMFVHGQGFPKGQNVGKQVEALLTRGKSNSRALRQVEQEGDGETYTVKQPRNGMMNAVEEIERKTFSPATDDAKEWAGWNTQLKPAYEPIVIARKPVEKTIARNVLKYGTGAFNVDACRVPTDEFIMTNGVSKDVQERQAIYGLYGEKRTGQTAGQKLGRYPANLVHDGSPEVIALFPNTGKSRGGGGVKRVGTHVYDGGYKGKEYDTVGFMDSGSAARFFYCAKPSRKERGEGNSHPTVKSVALMRWLVRLVTRRGGLVLDPFMGSGTTGIAALQEGMRFVGIERDADYMEIAKRRIAEAEAEIEQAREKERHEFIQQELPS